MTVHVINLDRDTWRFETFLENNGHLRDIVRTPAVDGRTIDRASLLRLGTITEDVTYTNGHLGCALSHIRLWRRAVRERRAITIAEDDAVFARNFDTASQRVLDGLPHDWDIVLWGFNFDSFVWTEIPDGVAGAILRFNQDQLRANIDTFRAADVVSQPFRLRHAFGLCGYSLSPAGADALLRTCLPLAKVDIHFDDGAYTFPNEGIDSIANAAYPLMNGYICIPPLVVSENRHETSRNLRDA